MVYVTSDIHGQIELFNRMLKKINFTDNDVLYVLGVDRGPAGIKLLLKIMRTPNIHMLLGNHELMMNNTLLSYNDRELMWNYANVWFQNGGQITLQQFLKYSENTQKKIIKYIDKLPSEFRVTVNDIEFVLCHAIPSPSSFKINPFENTLEGLGYHTEREMAAWERHLRLKDDNFKGKIIIHGHTPTKFHDENGKMSVAYYDEKGFLSDEPNNKTYEINIDCGCSYIAYDKPGGRLACIRLDDMQVFYEDPEDRVKN